ncbi:hypothetical protein ACFO26_09080 [Lactococcus nasutitermitis]|uniref:Uncharacterized protein n=1 Tax=Lactococcus nasutitermitis TaxID=1652957 RepID=A0ABV9JHV4_9LACT|nr:hypothetical protein [Lactococcus nasutitermitis]
MSLTAVNNGTPIVNGVYSAVNVQKVYSQMKMGEFSSDEMNSATWLMVKSTLSFVEGQKDSPDIILPTGAKIGNGQQHTEAEMPDLISLLIQYGGGNLLTNGQSGNFFHQPSPKFANKFTNNQGNAVAVLPAGKTLILDGSGKVLKLVDITSTTKQIMIDTANLNDRLSAVLENPEKESRSNFNQYIIQPNRTLTYKITIKKDFNQNGGVISVVANNNLVIDSIKADNSASTISPIASSSVNNSQNVTFPVLSQDEVLIVHAHVTPTSLSDLTPSGATLVVSGGDTNGNFVKSSSPAVILTGINFAMVDTQANKFVTGGEYILGRKVAGGDELYSNNAQWVKVANLNQLDLNSLTKLEGGKQYAIGDIQTTPIPLETSRFNFKSKKALQINSSLIQLVGLAPGPDYFLYQITPPKGYSLNKNLIHFTVFSRAKITKNGSLIAENSLGISKNPDYSLNTSIPDFSAGVQEYNILATSGESVKPMSSFIRIILPISILVALMLAMMIIIVRIL